MSSLSIFFVFFQAFFLVRGLDAATWTLKMVGDAELKLSADEMARLQAKHPRLDQGSEDVDALLLDLSIVRPWSLLEAVEQQDGNWIVWAKAASVVTDISIEKVPRDLKPKVESAVFAFRGEVDGDRLRKRIVEEAVQALRQEGFLSASARLLVAEEDSEVEMTLDFDIGDPCYVSKVVFPFSLPSKVKNTIRSGELCAEPRLRELTDEMDIKLKDLGYSQSRLSFKEFATNADKTRAEAILTGNLGQKIRYRIVDNTKRFLIDDLFSTDELSKIDPNIVGPEAMASELQQRYRSRGYLDVVVTGPEVEHPSPQETEFVYQVEPGPQYQLDAVQVEGAKAISQDEVISLLGLSSFWTSQVIYNPEEVEEGVERVKARYIELGYVDVEVQEQQPSKDRERGTVQLLVTIKEGPRYLLLGWSLVGQKKVPLDELNEVIDLKQNVPLDRSRLLENAQKMRSYLISKGFLYATVEVQTKESRSDNIVFADAHFQINEGERVSVGDIAIRGLTFTHPKIVERELLFKTGDPYNPELIATTRRELFKLGFFRSVQITPVNPTAVFEKRTVLDLVVDVREAATKNVSFGPGWSTFYGLRFGVDGSYTNILGTGRQVYGRATLSEEKQQPAIDNKTLVGRSVAASFVEPYLLGLPVDGTISASQSAKATEETWELTRGGELGVKYRFRRWIENSWIEVFYGRKTTRSEGAREKFDAFLANDVQVGQYGLRFELDKRDDRAWPTSGYLVAGEGARARYFLGGDIDYTRYDLFLGKYFNLSSGFVFALGAGFTTYEDVTRKGRDQGDVLPYSERLFTGGADSVRGFRERTLGPIVRRPEISSNGEWTCGFVDSYSGGSRRVIMKAELRYKVNDAIGATTFADLGNTYFTADEESKFRKAFIGDVDVSNRDQCGFTRPTRDLLDNYAYNASDLKHHPEYLWTRNYRSYGLAMNILTPIGSVNLAYGLPWHEPSDRECGEEKKICQSRAKNRDLWVLRGEFHLNVGARF